MATGDIHNPAPGLKALRNNPRLHMIRPPAVPPPRLNNITPPDKPIPTIRHARPPSNHADLLAGASPNKNARNQWDGDAAYGDLDIGSELLGQAIGNYGAIISGVRQNAGHLACDPHDEVGQGGFVADLVCGQQ
ncbi:hypothetical protein [Phaeobacter sp. CAU 1743]|uniref:hypothetical protein n=1 Tax=Phaeobacter sp. CAU 1743 TaxID=3140367 RepID=UPI00325BA54D